MKILVTGSRTWTDTLTIYDALVFATRNQAPEAQVTVLHGGASGADRYAAHAAKLLSFAVEEYAAEWQRYGKAGGTVGIGAMLASALTWY